LFASSIPDPYSSLLHDLQNHPETCTEYHNATKSAMAPKVDSVDMVLMNRLYQQTREVANILQTIHMEKLVGRFPDAQEIPRVEQHLADLQFNNKLYDE
jgi:hypothetical protein